MISFTIFGQPTPKGRPRFTNVGKFGRCYTPKKTKDAEEDFISQAVKHRPEQLLEGPLKLVVRFYKPKPKSKPKKVYWWTTKPDLDNFCKLVKDALNGVFWKDDSQIVDLVASKRYGEPARVEVEIYKLGVQEYTCVGGEKIIKEKIEND